MVGNRLLPDLAIRTIRYMDDQVPKRIECYYDDPDDVVAGKAAPAIVLDHIVYMYQARETLMEVAKQVPPEMSQTFWAMIDSIPDEMPADCEASQNFGKHLLLAMEICLFADYPNATFTNPRGDEAFHRHIRNELTKIV